MRMDNWSEEQKLCYDLRESIGGTIGMLGLISSPESSEIVERATKTALSSMTLVEQLFKALGEPRG